MFKKYYKLANEDIKPNRVLIDDIFSKAETIKTKKFSTFMWAGQYGTLAAAAVVLLCFAVSKFDINKTQENPHVQSQVPVAISNTETETQNSAESYIKARIVPEVPEIILEHSEFQMVTEEEATEIEVLLFEKLNSDENVFSITGKTNYNESIWYIGEWTINSEKGHLVKCDFVVNKSLTDMYECNRTDTGITWKEENNFIN